MKDLFDFNNIDISNNQLFEMANLLPKRTGLKYTIWYSAKIPKHKARIKVDLTDNNSIAIEIETKKITGNPKNISQKDLNNIFDWIDLNKEILLQYWNNAHTGTIDTGDVTEKIVKIS